MTADYRDVRVLVTGHTGFKGAWLAEWLLAQGAVVGGLALPPDGPSLYGDLGLDSRTLSVMADILDADATHRAVADFAPDIVFHLAAQSLVRPSYADPAHTFAVNVMGTVNVIEAARAAASVRAVVCATSDKCYENDETGRAFAEGDALGGKDPYSASKGAAEIVAGSYRRAVMPLDRRPRLATVRAGNVIGGGDRALDRLIPDLARAFAAGRAPVLRNPGAVRPWQHVLEPLRGYLALGRALLDGEAVEGPWNFGPNAEAEVTVGEIAGRFARAWGPSAPAPVIEPSPLSEAGMLRLDSAKAAAGLDWRPALGLDEAVAMTADWWRAQIADPAGIAAFTSAQIARYEAGASG
ncbi:MAG TPA: CDP-glucose 4,6-dehydratase [Caulobacteraceae bacterium]